MTTKTTKLTQLYWLKTLAEWLDVRIDTIPAPQFEEATQAIADIKATIEQPLITLPDVPGDFTNLMDAIGDAFNAPNDYPSLVQATGLIAAYLSDKIAIARESALREGASHTYRHEVPDDTPTIHTTVTKNTKGYNFEASVTTRGSVEANRALLDTVIDSLKRTYGSQGGGE